MDNCFKRFLSLMLAVLMVVSYVPAEAFATDYVEVDSTVHEHNYEESIVAEATCTEAGLVGYTCSCEDSYTEEIPANGHDFVDGACTVCGEADPDYVAPSEETVAPTEETEAPEVEETEAPEVEESEAATEATEAPVVEETEAPAETVEVELDFNGTQSNEVAVENPVAMIGEAGYDTLADAAAAAQSGDEIILQDDVTFEGTVELPAGITLNGNDKTINGSIKAGGDLTIAGNTTVTTFSAGWYNNTITIGEGASLKVTGGRVTVSYGNIFNITGSVTDAKTADKTVITPSLEIVSGLSFNGNGDDVQFNVTNAYVVLGDSSTKDSGATGKFNMNFTNSIVDFTKTLKTCMPTASGLAPEFNFNAKDSVVNFASHLELWLDETAMTLDNTKLTVGGSFANAGELTVTNGSEFVVKAPIMSSHGGNTGTINVTGGSFELVDSNEDWQNAGSMSVSGNGKLVINDFKNVNDGSVVVDVTGMNIGDSVADRIVLNSANTDFAYTDIEVAGNSDLVIDTDGKLAERDLTQVDGVYQINDLADLKLFAKKVNDGNTFSGKTVKLMADIDLAETAARTTSNWTAIKKFNGTFDGDNHTISNLVVIGEGNQGFFAQVADQTEHVSGTVKNVTFHNAIIKSTAGQGNAGVIALAPLGARINNVHLTGTVEIEGYRGVAGIVGNGFPVMDGCSVEAEGTITATYWGVGGILGFASDKGAKVSNSTIKSTGSGLTIHGELGGVGAVTGTPHGAATNGATVSGVEISSNNNYYMAYVDAGGAVSGNVTVSDVTVKVNGEEIVGNDAVATIGDTPYFSLQAAVNAAAEGDTITLLADIEQVDGVKITDKKLTIDLNDKTFTVSEGASTNNRNFKIDGASVVTIKNGTMIAAGDYSSGAYGTVRTEGTANVTLEDLKLYNYRGNGLNVKALVGTTVTITDVEVYSEYGGGIEAAGGTIELTNVTVEQKGMYTAPYNSMAISVNGGGTVTVNSGTYTTECITAEEANNQGTSHGPWVAGVLNSGGTLIINGGTFSNDNYGDNALATAARGLLLVDTAGKIEINDGTFNAVKNIFDLQNNLGDADNQPSAQVDGGTFSANPTVAANNSSFIKLPKNYVAKQNADGTWGIKSNSEAWIFREGIPEYFENFTDAVESAVDGEIIIVSANIRVEEELILDKSITISDYNQMTIRFVEGGAIHLTGDNTLTLDKVFVKNAKIYADSVDAGAKVNGEVVTGIASQPSDLAFNGKNNVLTLVNPQWVAKVGDTYYVNLQDALKAVAAGGTVTLVDDVTITENWDRRYTGATFSVPVTIDGNDHTIKFACDVADGANYHVPFRFEADATIKDLTIDMSAATNSKDSTRIRAVSAKANLTIDGCTFIGNDYTNTRAVIFGEGAGDNVGNLTVSVTDSKFIDWTKGLVDNENGQDVKAVTATGNTFTNSSVALSAADSITFTDNTISGAEVTITSYTGTTKQVMVKDNTLVNATGMVSKAASYNNVQSDFVKNAPIVVNGTQYFSTLEDAAKAIATDGSDTTIELMENIEVANSIDFNYGTGKIVFTADKPVTVKQTKNGLDLGFTISNAANIVVDKNVTFEISDNSAGMYLYYGPSLTVNGAITGGANWGCLYLFNGEHVVSKTGKVAVGRTQIAYNDLTVQGEMDTNYLLVEGATFTADGAIVDANVIFDNNNGGQRWGASEFVIKNASAINTSKLTLSYADSKLMIDASSKLTAAAITGAGKIVIDGSDYVMGSGYQPIEGKVSNFTGTIEVVNNDDLKVVIEEDGNVVLKEKDYVAQIGESKYESVAEALAAAQKAGMKDVTITLLGEVTKDEAIALEDSFYLYTKQEFDNVTFKQADPSKVYYIDGLYTGSRTNGGSFVFDGVNLMVIGQYIFEGNVVLKNNSYIGSVAEANCFIYNGTTTIEPGSKLKGVIEDFRGGDMIVDGGKTDGTYNNEADVQDAIMYIRWDGDSLSLKNGAYVKINAANEVGRMTLNGGTSAALDASKLDVWQWIEVNGTLTLDTESQITTQEIKGSGKIIIDAADYKSGETSTRPIAGKISGFTGKIEIINNEDLKYVIDANDNLVLVEKVYIVEIEDGKKYESVQEAIDAAQNGDTINLLVDGISENVTVVQAPNKAITIDGNDKTFNGTITVDGKSARYDTAGLTIKNVQFDATNISKDACINLGDGKTATRYTSNVKVENCTFTGNYPVSEKVGIKSYTGGDKNLTVTDCTATGMHSLMQVKNVIKVTVSGCTIENSKNGIALGKSHNAVVTGCIVDVEGYGIRADAESEEAATPAGATISGSTIKASQPVVIRNVAIEYDLTVGTENTFTAAEGNAAITFTAGDDGVKAETPNVAVKLGGEGLNIKDIFPAYQAKIGDTYYPTFAAAISAAEEGNEIDLLADIKASEVILIDKSVTINGNNHKVTSSANRIFRVTASNVVVTLNDVDMVSTAVMVYPSDVRGISIDPSLTNTKLTLNNCSIDFTDKTTNDWTYAVNVSGNGTGHTVTVNGGTYEGANVINVHGANNTVVVKDATLNCLYPNNDVYYGATIWVLQNQGSAVEATGNTFNGDNAVAFNLGTGTTLTESDNIDNTKRVIAKIGDTYYHKLADAFAAAGNGDTVKLLADITIDSETITIADGKSVTLDMNSKKITVTDNKTSNYELFYIYGEMTVTGNGTIELTSTNNRAWDAMSAIFHNRGGVLTIENGTYKNLGGTDMAWVIDNSGNWYGDATTNISDGEFISTYTAIRNRMEQNSHGASGKAILNIFGGKIDGTTSAIWAQAASTSTTAPATGEINISGGEIGLINTARSAGAESMTSIKGGTVAAFKGEVNELQVVAPGTITGEVTILDAEGKVTAYVIDEEGYYVDAPVQIGTTGYKTLEEAFTAAKAGDEVVINKAGTYALSTSGKDITITGAVDGVVFDNIGAHGMGGANVTFNNVTFNYAANSTYKGLQHAGNLVYNDCTFNGQVFLYGESETFNNCIFNNTGDNYNVWTYGAKEVGFNGCTFNSDGKSVLIYAEGANIFNDVTVTDCDFIASAPVDGKAAIEMDSSLTAGIELTIDAATTATGFGTGNISGNSLWNNKKGNEGKNNDITVTVDDVVVLKPIKTASIGTVYYTTLDAAIADAKVNDTVTLLTDVTIDELIKIENAITLDLNGKTVTATSKKAFEIYADATIKNGTIEAANRCVDTRKAVALTLDSVNLIADDYNAAYGNPQPLTIGGSENGTKVTMTNSTISAKDGYGIIVFVETEATITGSTISGYNALYMKPGSEKSVINFIDSDLTGDLSNNDVEGNSFSVIAIQTDNVTVNADADSTITSIGNYNDAVSIGWNQDPDATGNKVTIRGTISGNVLDVTKINENTVTVSAEYGAALNKEGYAYITNGDGSITAAMAVAQVGESIFATLQEAIDAVESEATIIILENIDLTEGATVPAGKTITLDLNGHNITGTPVEAKAYAVITNNGSLTITGNGIVKCDHKLAGSTGYAVNTITNCGTLTIDGATIVNASTASNQIGYAIDNNSTSTDAVVTVKSGMITVSGSNYYDGIRQFCNSLTAANSVTVTGGEVSSIWLQNPSDGTTDRNTKDVNGSVVISGGKVGALYLEPSSAFEASITGGDFGKVQYFENAENRDLVGFISGGVFTNAPEYVLIAEGFGLYYTGGKFNVVPDSVAFVDGEIYGTIRAAIEAAKDGDTILLLKNVEQKKPLIVEKNITLDLNGMKINGNGVYPVIRVQGGANVTVKNGEITNTDYVFVLGASDGTSAGNLTIESGTYHGDTTVASVTKGTLTILDGKFSVADGEYGATYLLNCIDANYNDGSAKIIVTGGTFTGFDPMSNAAEGTNTNFCAEGYVSENSNNVYSVVLDKVAEVDGETYGTIRAAIEAAEDGDTILLLKNVEQKYPLTVEKNITLDLNGMTITGDTYPVIRVQNGANVTVKNGEITNTDYVFVLGASDSTSAGNLTIESGKYHGVITVASVTKGTLTILDGEFSVADNAEYGATYLLNCIDANYNDGSAKIIVTGGTFTGFDPMSNAAEGTNTNFCAEGYISTTNDNGVTYNVIVDMVAAIVKESGHEYYATVAEALAAAESGETVILLQDAKEDMVMLMNSVTLDLNGCDLETSLFIALKGTQVLNTKTTGILKVPQNGISLQQNNTYVPVWNEVDGYYLVRFGWTTQLVEAETKDSVTYKFIPKPRNGTVDNLEVVELLQNGATDNQLKVEARVAWETGDGPMSLKLEYTDTVIGGVYTDNPTLTGSACFVVTVSGYQNFENVKVNAAVVSDYKQEYTSSQKIIPSTVK